MTCKISVIPSAACFDKRIIPQQLRVLAIISSYGANRDRGCWPSYNRLAEDVGISRRALIKYIKHLCECGYIEKEPRAHRNGGSRSNLYRIVTDIYIQPEDGDLGGAKDAEGVLPDSMAGGDAQVDGLNMNKENKNKENKNIYTKNSLRTPAKKISLARWEEMLGGKLCIDQMRTWIRANKLDENKIPALIEEFRDRMNAGENLYANFVSAFKVWLRNGWLMKTFDEVKLSDLSSGGVILQEKGLSL